MILIVAAVIAGLGLAGKFRGKHELIWLSICFILIGLSWINWS